MAPRFPSEAVGVGLLLTGSSAFGHLAEELVAIHDRLVSDAKAEATTLDQVLRMAEFAGWWCGLLEGEADHIAGFDPTADAQPGGNAHRPTASRRVAARQARCPRRRPC